MRKLLLAVLLLTGCTDSTDISLFIPFALFASDELSASSSGICGFTPITQAQGFYKGSGLLELDPDINPNAEYVLGLQVENYLDETLITDSNGDPIEGPQRNDFSIRWATVHYDDLEGALTGVSDVTVYSSGTVRPGGEQNAASVVVQAVGPGVVGSWVQSFEAKSLLSETVILSVQIFGDLNSGEQTQTGGRLKRVASYLRDEESFCFTYGDGVSDVNITQEIEFHRGHGLLATVVCVQPPGRYGALDITGTKVTGFTEKPKGDGGWINAGFFVLSPKVMDFIAADGTVWEQAPLSSLAAQGQLAAFPHRGFWHPMDTLRDRILLEDLWKTGKAPWKTW